MPTEDRFWLHDHERVLPGLADPGQEHDSHAVHRGEPDATNLATEDDHLLAQQRVFDDEVLLAAQEIGRGAEEDALPRTCPSADFPLHVVHEITHQVSQLLEHRGRLVGPNVRRNSNVDSLAIPPRTTRGARTEAHRSPWRTHACLAHFKAHSVGLAGICV